MKKAQAGQHQREHGSLLAAQEKRLLVWMAERLPNWVNSDHLSLLGLFAMLGAGLAFWAGGCCSTGAAGGVGEAGLGAGAP